MPTINLTDDELAALTAAIRRIIEDDKFPYAPRLDPKVVEHLRALRGPGENFSDVILRLAEEGDG